MVTRNERGHRERRDGNYVMIEMFQELQEQIQQLAAAFEQVISNRGNGRNSGPDHPREEKVTALSMTERTM